MASSLEICELIEQLIWPHQISICLVLKENLIRNLMAMTVSKKMC